MERLILDLAIQNAITQMFSNLTHKENSDLIIKVLLFCLILYPKRNSNLLLFVGLAYYQGKDIVFRFIIEYSSLRDFGTYVIDLILYEDFWKMIFWLVLKLDISFRVIMSWRILAFFRGFFWRLYFWMVKYLILLLH